MKFSRYLRVPGKAALSRRRRIPLITATELPCPTLVRNYAASVADKDGVGSRIRRPESRRNGRESFPTRFPKPAKTALSTARLFLPRSFFKAIPVFRHSFDNALIDATRTKL